VLGADGFGFAPDTRLQQSNDPRLWVRVPQLGGVVVGDYCDIGANTTIDCGALDDTVLGRNVLLDNQIQVAHNVKIGDFTAIAGCTAIAGSAEIGSHCLIGGAVGIAGHLQICDGVTVLAMSLVSASITEKGVYGGSMPLMPQRDWRKNAVQIRRLDQSLRSLQARASKDDTPDDHLSN
jgi:UDP-3-O-[3-hydroxymyristoyl] glucosamine N-acyltransferase